MSQKTTEAGAPVVPLTCLGANGPYDPAGIRRFFDAAFVAYRRRLRASQQNYLYHLDLGDTLPQMEHLEIAKAWSFFRLLRCRIYQAFRNSDCSGGKQVNTEIGKPVPRSLR